MTLAIKPKDQGRHEARHSSKLALFKEQERKVQAYSRRSLALQGAQARSAVRSYCVPGEGRYHLIKLAPGSKDIVLWTDSRRSGYQRKELYHWSKQKTPRGQTTIVVNGTFYGGNETAGNTLGIKVSDPLRQPSKPHTRFQGPCTKRNLISNRKILAIGRDGTPVLYGSKEELLKELQKKKKDFQKKHGSKSKEKPGVKTFYKVILGGLAVVTPKMAKLQSNNEFMAAFSKANHSFNGKSAYHGLDGGINRGRTAIGICNKNGKKFLMIFSVTAKEPWNPKQKTFTGDGAKLRTFARRAYQAGGGMLENLLILDGGSSTFVAQKGGNLYTEGNREKGDGPTTAIKITL